MYVCNVYMYVCAHISAHDNYCEIFRCNLKHYKYDLYHGVWVIAMVTFDVPQEIYAHNMPVDREI